VSVLHSFLFGAAACATGLAGCALVGHARWTGFTRSLRASLEQTRVPIKTTTVDFHELDDLPVPVRRYFHLALQDRQPMIETVHARHSGTFNLSESGEKWRRFTSDQIVVPAPPGFVWNAEVRLFPGLPVRVHDAYVAGEGVLRAALLGLIPVASLRGRGALAESELMRFLAEACWYPTALLPVQGVHWEARDKNSAYVRLIGDHNQVQLLVTFDEYGFIAAMFADARPRAVGSHMVPTPWLCRLWNYKLRHGMHVPLDAEVAWVLPSGTCPYWRGHIEEITYGLAV
jgi:hypothetical protein